MKKQPFKVAFFFIIKGCVSLDDQAGYLSQKLAVTTDIDISATDNNSDFLTD